MQHSLHSSDIAIIKTSALVLEQQGFHGWHRHQTQAFRALSCAERNYDNFKQRTDRAKAPLTCMTDMLTYNALYSAQHFARFHSLLQQVSRGKSAAVTRLAIVDYGCGQGLASLALLDRLQQHRLDLDIYLVEPSAHALYAAQCYVQAFASRLQGQVRVHPVCAYLGEEPEAMLRNQSYTIHLFSNVLDLAGQRPLNLQAVFSNIAQALGKHLLLAISPDYYPGHRGFRQILDTFPSAAVCLDSTLIQAEIGRDYDLADPAGGRKGKRQVKGRALALLLDNSQQLLAA